MTFYLLKMILTIVFVIEEPLLDPIQTMAPDNTVYLCTFSKVLAPGLRIGFYAAPLKIASLMVVAKQSVDLHTSNYGQYLAAEYLQTGHLKTFAKYFKYLSVPFGSNVYGSRKIFSKVFSLYSP